MEFRDYQDSIIARGTDLILRDRFVYLAMQVRTGKTLTSLGIADKIAKKVLFLTKKKAMKDVVSDYNNFGFDFDLTVINYESMHKFTDIVYDMIILDEAHSLGAYPKPSKRAKDVKALIRRDNPYICLLSGTPTPESYSQMYHQVYGIPNNPFSKYRSFYRFCDDHVNVTQRFINGFKKNVYSDGKQSILDLMAPYIIDYTQQQAGFDSVIDEEILKVPISNKIYTMCDKLKKDLVLEIGDEVILADTGVKLMTKLHQLYSGTVKFESGNTLIVDDSKARYIKWKFGDKKIGIFYKFKAELEAIKGVLGDSVTESIDEFNESDKSIALQIVSGREGISLRNAEFLVFYNIDFSATSYWQARDRMTTKDRKYNKVYWLFSDRGLENKIYKTVISKKNFTLKHFKWNH